MAQGEASQGRRIARPCGKDENGPMKTRQAPVKPQDTREALRSSEQRLRSVLELSSDWYWEQDENLRYTVFSGTTFTETGFKPSSMIGKTRWEIPNTRVDPSKRAKLQAAMDARQPFRDFEYERAGPDGTVRYISASGTPAFDASGRFAGYRGIAKDVTREKREELLLRLEHTVTRSLAGAEGAAASLRAIIRAVCEMEGWDGGLYFRVDAEANVLRFSADESWSIQDPAVERYLSGSSVVISPGVGLAGRVWQSGQPLWITDLGTDARARRSKLARETGLHG